MKVKGNKEGKGNKEVKGSYIKITDKNDLLSAIFGYPSLKQAEANHNNITKNK